MKRSAKKEYYDPMNRDWVCDCKIKPSPAIGKEPPQPSAACSECHGSGKIHATRSMAIHTCPACHGSGVAGKADV
jgi:DnaJ-class molecular chaperone